MEHHFGQVNFRLVPCKVRGPTGMILSPILFSVAIDRVMRKTRDKAMDPGALSRQKTWTLILSYCLLRTITCRTT